VHTARASEQSHHTEEGTVVTDPKDTRNGVKTLGIRLPAELHAQFALVAQLDDLNLTDAILRAVELYVETKRAEGDFAARAAAVLEEIEREAAARRAAIQGLFGTAGETKSAPTEKARAAKKTGTDA
jgi:hypothetical protein